VVPGTKNGVRGLRKNTFGRELRTLRLSRGFVVLSVIANLQSLGWDIDEVAITDIET